MFQAKVTTKEKNYALIMLITRKGPHAFEAFLHVLLKSHQRILLDQILSKLREEDPVRIRIEQHIAPPTLNRFLNIFVFSMDSPYFLNGLEQSRL